MKKLFLSIIYAALTLYGNAQSLEKPVLVNYVHSYDEAIEKAHRENKLIFFNCFADWAVPCHSMNAVVFSDREFADFLNSNFVNLFVEMVGTPEGKALADMYGIKTYAHYLILNAKGEIVHRIVGGSKLPGFQEEVRQALNPETSLAGLLARFQKGERGKDFLRLYLNTVYSANMSEQYDEALPLFLEQLKEDEYPLKENWSIVSQSISKPTDKLFHYLVEHKNEFLKYNDGEIIDGKLTKTCIMDFFQIASGEIRYSPTTFQKYDSLLKKLDLSSSNPIFVIRDIAYYRGTRQYDKMMDALEQGHPTLEPNVMAPTLELSLSKTRDYTPAQKERIIAYLKIQQANTDEKSKKHYQKAIDEITYFKGILFDDLTFNEALVKAQKENKLIFMDCYTSWCGPCKMMSEQVFVQAPVGELFNKNFINLKIDMEKGEGKELAQKYAISVYPTMLLLDGKGNIVHRIIGGMDVKTLLEKIQRGMNPTTSYGKVKQKYESGDRSAETRAAYLIVMDDAGELKNAPAEIATCLSTMSVADKCKPAPWLLFTNYIKDYKSPIFQQFVNEKSEYEKYLDKETINQKLENVYFLVLLSHLTEPLAASELETIEDNIRKSHMNPESIVGYLQQLVGLYNQQKYTDILNLYKNDISGISNAQDKLNLDLVLGKLMRSAPKKQQKEALDYAMASQAKADKRAINGYRNLVQALTKLLEN